jgi:hypothetical protein
MAGTQRYWDGDDWTGEPAPWTPPTPTPKDNTDKVVIAGFVLAILFPIGGFVAGAVALRKEPMLGAVLMVLSIAMTYFWFYALG